MGAKRNPKRTVLNAAITGENFLRVRALIDKGVPGARVVDAALTAFFRDHKEYTFDVTEVVHKRVDKKVSIEF